MQAVRNNTRRLKKKEWNPLAHKIAKESNFGVRRVCKRIDKSGTAYYKVGKTRQRQFVNEDFIVEAVLQVRQIHPRAGVRKLLLYIAEALAEAGITIGRDRLFEILRKRNLLIEKRRGFVPKTTRFDKTLPLAQNLVKDLEITEVNQVLYSDITYIRTDTGFLYLTLITDAFSHKIVGYNSSDTLEAKGSLDAFYKAISNMTSHKNAIFHSDRGCQFCSHEFVDALNKHNIKRSTTEENHCYENAVAERVNGILKQEYFLDIQFKTKAEARRAIDQVINTYNKLRIHTSLGNKTPDSVYYAAA